ncbi:MAG: alpha/beta hydrolase [Kineosporiaceae bacterium]
MTPSGPSLTVARAGEGAPALVLHGGGGPASVAGLVDHLASTRRVLAPTHPGWAGTPRHPAITGIRDLAEAYLDLLEEDGASGAALVGSSIGGWIAAAMAVADDARSRRLPGRPRAVAALVLVAAVGIEVEGEPVFDVRSAPPPATAGAVALATWDAILAYACEPHYMHDPGLRAELARIDVPTLLVWGADDDVCTPGYGRAYAALIPGSTFVQIPGAGHLPHVDRPAETFEALDRFLEPSV